MRQAATALSASGWVESRPSRWRKGKRVELAQGGREVGRGALGQFVQRLRRRRRAGSSESEAWNRRSRPRCTSSRSRLTSSSAISASGDIVLPRRSESERADSKRTFCHSSWRAACSEGIGPEMECDIHRRAGRHQLL